MFLQTLQVKTVDHWRNLRTKFDAVDKADAMRTGVEAFARKAAETGIRVHEAVDNIKADWRRWGLEQEKKHEAWRRELATELDAALNKMDFDRAIKRFGFPVSYEMHDGRYTAVWEHARMQYTPWILSPYFLWVIPHGFRLRLTFDNTTHLRYWNYQEW